MIMSLIYVVLAALVFIINVIPAFMPPTWTILTFFYTQFHLQLLPTVIIGAVTATGGRVVLAKLSQTVLRPYLPKKLARNYGVLGKYLQRNQKLTIPIILTYAFFPISSNQIFIIAGLTNLNIRLIAFSFFVGRLISYTFWVSAAHQLTLHLQDIFSKRLTNISNIVIQILSLGLIVVVGKIDWKKVLRLKENK